MLKTDIRTQKKIIILIYYYTTRVCQVVYVCFTINFKTIIISNIHVAMYKYKYLYISYLFKIYFVLTHIK